MTQPRQRAGRAQGLVFDLVNEYGGHLDSFIR